MFKDGKIRINIPTINKMTSESTTLGGDLSGQYELTLTKDDPVSTGREQIVVFKKDGKTTKGAKESIEKLFNTLIDKAINFTSTAKEEWQSKTKNITLILKHGGNNQKNNDI